MYNVIYRKDNDVYSGEYIKWTSPLIITGISGTVTMPTTGNTTRDDLGGSTESIDAVNGIHLPPDTGLVMRTTTLSATVDFRIQTISSIKDSIVQIIDSVDTIDVLLYVASSGVCYNKVGQSITALADNLTASIAYTTTNALIKTTYDSGSADNDYIVDVISHEGVTLSDYGQTLATRISLIIDETMKSDSITKAISDVDELYNKMGLDGATVAKLKTDFINSLTNSVMTTAMQIGNQSMVGQKQGELYARQTRGFDDNLLVEATKSLGNIEALSYSGSGTTTPVASARLATGIDELFTRSGGVTE